MLGHGKWVSIFIWAGHYLGHYNDLAEVIIYFSGCGYPDLRDVMFFLNAYIGNLLQNWFNYSD